MMKNLRQTTVLCQNKHHLRFVSCQKQLTDTSGIQRLRLHYWWIPQNGTKRGASNEAIIVSYIFFRMLFPNVKLVVSNVMFFEIARKMNICNFCFSAPCSSFLKSLSMSPFLKISQDEMFKIIIGQGWLYKKEILQTSVMSGWKDGSLKTPACTAKTKS